LSDNSLQSQVADTFDYLELMWRDYVVNLNSFRQHQAVVDPGAATMLEALPDWIGNRSTERWFRDLGARFGLRIARTSPAERQVFDWRMAAMTALGLAVLIGGWQVAALVWRRLLSWLGWQDTQLRSPHRPPPFYLRLETLLARIGLRRGAGQTAVEFAQTARNKLGELAQPKYVAGLPPEVVQAYYRVRFGGHALDNSETEAIEHALAKLVPAVTRPSSASAVTTR
jgi:hypothetical protein